jgi:hypothetical protein
MFLSKVVTAAQSRHKHAVIEYVANTRAFIKIIEKQMVTVSKNEKQGKMLPVKSQKQTGKL